MEPRYWISVQTRNGAQTIRKTLDSLLSQSIPPDTIIVVDDGSIDATQQILNEYTGQIAVVRFPDRGYDVRRVASNVNAGCQYMEKEGGEYDFWAHTGDDCVFPLNYAETVMSRMQENPNLVIASGDWGVRPPPETVKAPQGAGRFVRMMFWRQIGSRYPTGYGWESWLFLKARQLGFETANFIDLRYEHLKASGTRHGFKHWGIAMRALGYHPLIVLRRCVLNFFGRNDPIPFLGNVRMLTGYLWPPKDRYFQYFDSDVRSFIRQEQLDRVLKIRGNGKRAFAYAAWTLMSTWMMQRNYLKRRIYGRI